MDNQEEKQIKAQIQRYKNAIANLEKRLQEDKMEKGQSSRTHAIAWAGYHFGDLPMRR